MQQVSLYLEILFGLTTLLTVWAFFRAARKSFLFLGITAAWMLVLFLVARTGFFTNGHAMPPRFPLLVAPPVITIIALFATRTGRRFIDGLNIKWLTLLHTVRIPVECILYFLFVAGTIPGIMTFEGWNMDIIAGITAPLIYVLAFVRKGINRGVLIAWNILCTLLLLNIVTIAILSADTPFQRLAFEQPNIAVTYFPFVWLPGVVVPLVLFSHLAAIRQLARRTL